MDANSLAEAITHTYQASIDEFMPLKRRKNSRVGKPDDRPWITAGLKASISHMFELLRISKESRSPHDYEIYKKYLNKLTHLKEKAKNKYYRDKSELYGNDKSKAWQLVNDIANYKKKTKTNVKNMVDENGNKLTNSIDIANCLNNHFATVGSKMAQKFDDINSSRLKDPLSYISKDVKNSLFLSLPTSHEISKIISNSNEKKSSHGAISNKVTKMTNETISPY